MKYPQLIKVDVNENKSEVKLIIKLNEELEWFKGHFENNPILPGIAIINFVIKYTREFLNLDFDTHKYTIKTTKFSNSAIPNKTYELHISLHRNKNELIFKLSESEENIICTQGKFIYE